MNMNHSVDPYQFESHAVRTINHDGEIWFVAADVAAALEYRDAEVATRYLDSDEKGYTDLELIRKLY